MANSDVPSDVDVTQLISGTETKLEGLVQSTKTELSEKIKAVAQSQSELSSETSRLREQVESFTGELKSNSVAERLSEIEQQLLVVEAKSQTVIDLADDIVGSAANQIEKVQSQADLVLAQTDIVLTWYLGVLTIGLTIAFFIIPWLAQQKKQRSENEILRAAAQKLSGELKNNSEFRNTFVAMLSENDALRNNINHAIKTVADELKQELTTTEDDQLRDEIADAIDNEAEPISPVDRIKAVWNFLNKGQEK